MTRLTDRELAADSSNPLEMDGIEFVEYATSRPQALGQVLEMIGFHPVARHRSREVLLYRQGEMNVIVNAHAERGSRAVQPAETPVIAAIALRVRNAAAACRYAVERGAWMVPFHVEPMELYIPAIHGVGATRIYFVDRYRDFSIYDIDFTRNPGVEAHPPPLTGLRWFGIVQYIGADRMADWTTFYRELFGFRLLPDEQRYGILPKGHVLQSSCRRFYLQLIAPKPEAYDLEPEEMLQRVGLGTPDVLRTVAALRERGVDFVESPGVHSETRGALTQGYLGGVMFELVHDERG
ncbi:MAG TPA: VOC family protein [Casimicrobiaceae bacterium]